ncbi:hypothetical protein C8R47DRAFT_1199510 [Mycena vitilis]|nr:hypothetical protein C8R47DRAFT_1199510 [Mycena vitilis]
MDTHIYARGHGATCLVVDGPSPTASRRLIKETPKSSAVRRLVLSPSSIFPSALSFISSLSPAELSSSCNHYSSGLLLNTSSTQAVIPQVGLKLASTRGRSRESKQDQDAWIFKPASLHGDRRNPLGIFPSLSFLTSAGFHVVVNLYSLFVDVPISMQRVRALYIGMWCFPDVKEAKQIIRYPCARYGRPVDRTVPYSSSTAARRAVQPTARAVANPSIPRPCPWRARAAALERLRDIVNEPQQTVEDLTQQSEGTARLLRAPLGADLCRPSLYRGNSVVLQNPLALIPLPEHDAPVLCPTLRRPTLLQFQVLRVRRRPFSHTYGVTRMDPANDGIECLAYFTPHLCRALTEGGLLQILLRPKPSREPQRGAALPVVLVPEEIETFWGWRELPV